MKLNTALRLNDGEIVAFTGAGGKTTALFRLADHLAEAGGRVIMTSLVPLPAVHLRHAPRHFSAFEANRANVEEALSKHARVLVTGPFDQTLGRAAEVTPGVIEDLSLVPDLTAILIKADSAEGRAFKAPAESEPMIPSLTTLVVNVAGLDVVGQPLTNAIAQHPEQVAALTGTPLGGEITPEAVAQVITHSQGGLKNVPAEARVAVLLNKAETPEALTAARRIAAQVLNHPRIGSALIGSARQGNPVREAHAPAAAVVLAAGRSTRMGRSKPLLPWGQGNTVVAEVVRRLLSTSVSDVVVVTGAEREAVEGALAELRQASGRVRPVFNPDFASSEMARSLQVGLRALPAHCLAVLVALVDQPQIEARVVEAVLQRWRETQSPVAAPFYQGQRGHPLLFDRALWSCLLALPAEANPREALREVPIERVDVDTDTILQDMDTPDDYERARGAQNSLARRLNQL
jgi:molybdenum cofactor cytidylyltransferase